MQVRQVRSEYRGYYLQECIKQHEYGSVYLGRSIAGLQQAVLIRIFQAPLSSLRDRQRFLQEVNFLSSLSHPALLPLLEAGIEKGEAYTVRVYKPGGSLITQLLQHGEAFSRPQMMIVLRRVGEALTYLHKHGIAHGGVKPENILFDAQQQAFLADVHLAALQAVGAANQPDLNTGTQAGGEGGQAATKTEQMQADIRAFGTIAYELLTGRQPFETDNESERIVVPPSSQLSPLPARVDAVFMRLLKPQTEEQFTSAIVFLEALQQAFDEPVALLPPPVQQIEQEEQSTTPDPSPSQEEKIEQAQLPVAFTQQERPRLVVKPQQTSILSPQFDRFRSSAGQQFDRLKYTTNQQLDRFRSSAGQQFDRFRSSTGWQVPGLQADAGWQPDRFKTSAHRQLERLKQSTKQPFSRGKIIMLAVSLVLASLLIFFLTFRLNSTPPVTRQVQHQVEASTAPALATRPAIIAPMLKKAPEPTSTAQPTPAPTPLPPPPLPSVVNAGFEFPNLNGDMSTAPDNAGWAFSGSAGIAGNGSDLTNDSPNAPQGVQVGFLQAHSSMSQDIYFAGGLYKVSFFAAQRANSSSNQSISVLIDGFVMATFTPTSTNYLYYTTYPFTVSTGTHTLQLKSLKGSTRNTVFIDAVTITYG